MTLKALQTALQKRRLDHRWSFERLADDMRQVVGQDLALSGATLFRFIRDGHQVTETTKHAMERYLTQVKEAA